MIMDDKHWNILINNVLRMKRRDWTNSSDFVTIGYIIMWLMSYIVYPRVWYRIQFIYFQIAKLQDMQNNIQWIDNLKDQQGRNRNTSSWPNYSVRSM